VLHEARLAHPARAGDRHHRVRLAQGRERLDLANAPDERAVVRLRDGQLHAVAGAVHRQEMPRIRRLDLDLPAQAHHGDVHRPAVHRRRVLPHPLQQLAPAGEAPVPGMQERQQPGLDLRQALVAGAITNDVSIAVDDPRAEGEHPPHATALRARA